MNAAAPRRTGATTSTRTSSRRPRRSATCTIPTCRSWRSRGWSGSSLFVAMLISIGVGIFRVLRAVRSNRTLYLCMRATLVLLVVIAIWLNDNPLFGAQTETVLAAMFLGMFAAAPAILRSTPSSATVNESR